MKVTDMIREHHSESNAARPKIIGNKGAESTLQRPSRTPHLYLCAGPSRLNPKGMRSRMCFWHFLKGLSKKKKKKPLGTLRNVYFSWIIQIAQLRKNLPAMQETQVQFLGWEDPLEKEMATHSSILAWRISWTEEPGGLQFTGSQELDTTEQLNHHPHYHRWYHSAEI